MKWEGEQVSPVFVYFDEAKEEIDATRSYCNVRVYGFSIDKVGPVQGSEYKAPIQYCDRSVGFKKYTDVATFWEKVRRELNRKSNNK